MQQPQSLKIDLYHQNAVDQLQSILIDQGLLQDKVRITFEKNAFVSLIQANMQTVDNRQIDVSALSQLVAKLSQLEWIAVDDLSFPIQKCIQYISKEFASHQKVLVLDDSQAHLLVGFANPLHQRATNEIESALDRKVKAVFINPIDFERYFLGNYKMKEMVQANQFKSVKPEASISNNRVKIVENEKDQGNIVNISMQILKYAFDHDASDIHIEVLENQGRYRMRVDGILHKIRELPKTITSSLINRFKVISEMNIGEKRLPQDGRIVMSSDDGVNYDIRVSTVPTQFGEKMVLRLFNSKKVLSGLEQNDMPTNIKKMWLRGLQSKNGLMIVVGPTGSGKSTTLYQSMQYLNDIKHNIYTIEDPIEMVFQGLNQIQVKQEIGLNFADIIRSLLRQDPDVMMVGEVRDLETARMALRAALTGHLVLTTVHAIDGASCISRLIDMGLQAKILASCFRLILSQRLLRILCNHCKSIDEDSTLWYELYPTEQLEGQIYQAVGCTHCHDTGYTSRQAIFELIDVEKIRECIVDPEFTELKLRQHLVANNHKELLFAAKQLLVSGQTSCSEVLRTVGFKSQ